LAELEDGRSIERELARVAVRSPETSAAVTWPSARGAPVAVCMATYNPPFDLFERQIESIRRQSHANWVCVISDDCSEPAGVDVIERVIGADPRFIVSRSPQRLGFYRNFERALALAPADAEFVAMADQDDCWHENKLQTLLSQLGSARLIYSDARVISRSG